MISIFSEDTKNRNPKALLCGYNAKISSRLTRLYLDRYWPLEYSIYLTFFFSLICIIFFVCNVALLLSSLLLIVILLLRPYESIKKNRGFIPKPR